MKLSVLVLTTLITTQVMAISVMSYNAENLFDAHHDVGKEDYTYLPKITKQTPEVQAYCKGLEHLSWMDSCLNLNWDNEAFYKKTFNLANVIKAYKGGADIVFLQEVENMKALTVLADVALEGFGYQTKVLIEGPDVRGIDVAVLSKYPVISSKLHPIELEGRPTRGILEVVLEISSRKVAVYSNHWPSQGNPTSARLAAADKLIEITNAVDADLIIAAGDLNTLSDEVPYPFETLLRNGFKDVEKRARLERMFIHPGTHWYKGHWSSLDKFFVKTKAKTRFYVDYKTFDILNLDWMMKKREWFNDMSQMFEIHTVPNRYSNETFLGYSDHLPIVMEVNSL